MIQAPIKPNSARPSGLPNRMQSVIGTLHDDLSIPRPLSLTPARNACTSGPDLHRFPTLKPSTPLLHRPPRPHAVRQGRALHHHYHLVLLTLPNPSPLTATPCTLNPQRLSPQTLIPGPRQAFPDCSLTPWPCIITVRWSHPFSEPSKQPQPYSLISTLAHGCRSS